MMGEQPLLTPNFQEVQSTFKQEIQGLMLLLNDHISEIRTKWQLDPNSRLNNASTRDPYRKFYRTFSSFMENTSVIISERNPGVIEEGYKWLDEYAYSNNHLARTASLNEAFEIVKNCRNELYKLGIIDLNISKSVAFPFNDILEDIHARSSSVS